MSKMMIEYPKVYLEISVDIPVDISVDITVDIPVDIHDIQNDFIQKSEWISL